MSGAVTPPSFNAAAGHARSESGFSIRPATEADLPAILALLETTMGEHSLASKPDYWRWKHIENPFGASPCLVADADGLIAGVRVFMRWRWESGERSVEAVRAVDTATHSDFRRKGVFSALTKSLLTSCGEQGVSFVFNTPNPRSQAGYLKMGWTTVARIPLMVRPLRPFRLLASIKRLRDSSGGHRLSEDGMPTVDDFLRSKTAEVLCAEGPSPESRYHTSQSREYLTWRYLRVPHIRYHAVWQDSSPSAALIFGIKERSGLREIVVTEVLVGADPAGRRQAARLLRRMCRDVEGDYAAASSPRNSPQSRALVRAGFFPVGGLGPNLCVRPLQDRPLQPDPARLSSWHCSIGDLELF